MDGGLVLLEKGRGVLSYGWGVLVFKSAPESVVYSMNLIRRLGLGGERPLVVTVGDVVSQNFTAYGSTDVAVVDGVTRRGSRVEWGVTGIEYRCKNPAGTISWECFHVVTRAVEEAAAGRRGVVYVEGEEDLLSLVALKACPLDSGWVIYGHWKGFLCLLPCTRFFKTKVDELLGSYFQEK
ncbi:MAG: DUF359 domain-containing protein [Infirmifilum sp.]